MTFHQHLNIYLFNIVYPPYLPRAFINLLRPSRCSWLWKCLLHWFYCTT